MYSDSSTCHSAATLAEQLFGWTPESPDNSRRAQSPQYNTTPALDCLTVYFTGTVSCVYYTKTGIEYHINSMYNCRYTMEALRVLL